MIGEYLLRLAIMLPLICGMIVAGLYLAKKFNLTGLAARTGNSRTLARLTETIFLTPGVKLAVVDFADKRLLVAVTKTGATLLSETAATPFKLEEGASDAR